jgi:hypothetical protein
MNHDALVAGDVATAAAAIGAVAIGAGALLWWTTRPSAKVGVTGVGLGPANLVVGGAW